MERSHVWFWFYTPCGCCIYLGGDVRAQQLETQSTNKGRRIVPLKTFHWLIVLMQK